MREEGEMTPQELPAGWMFRDDREGRAWWEPGSPRTVYAGQTYRRVVNKMGDCRHPADLMGPDGRNWCFGCCSVRPAEQILGPIWFA